MTLCLALTPQMVAAQTSQSNDDPPPILYQDDATAHGPVSFTSFICRTPFDDSNGALFCAGEVGFGGNTSIDVTGDAATYTFVLESHETVSLYTLGGRDTFGELFDAAGRRIAANDDGGVDENFRMTRTLIPGRYYIHVGSVARATAEARLRIRRTRPVAGIGPAAGQAEDLGNHCGRAALIAAVSTTGGTFDRPGDIDVFAVDLSTASDLLIAVDGAARYELKAADCVTSLGLADASFGATLASLPEGRYYLYLSRPDGLPGSYELQVELR